LSSQRFDSVAEASELPDHSHGAGSLRSFVLGWAPITALAYVLTMGDVSRFQRGKQVASYLGLIPTEHSSSHRRRLGSSVLPKRTRERSC
jgi:transposase IS116/IS110/IS902 family protein